MRVVADTNTVLSAFLWDGPPAAVLGAARKGRITLSSVPCSWPSYQGIPILASADALLRLDIQQRNS